jgi:hypothetical protein
MKNLNLLPFLLLLAQPVFSQAEFAPPGAEWYFKSTSGYTTEQFSYSGFSHLQYAGDTVFDGLTCKKICATLYRFENAQPLPCGQNAIFHFIYQRADSIFEFAPGPAPRSRFLFRNNYAIGDIVYAQGGFELSVQSIDTLDFNGRPVRRFHIGNGSLQPIICYDLFGPENGLFSNDPWELIADDGDVDLRCYQDAAFPQINVSNDPCDAVLSPAKPYFKIHLSPNPTRDELVIFIEASPFREMQLTIYDAAGHFVLEDRAVNYTWKKIPVAHLSPGVYYCVLRDGNSTFHQKFIKN